MAELQLDPKKTALVLIDLQNAIVGMNPVPHTAAQVVENSKKLADAFRVQGAPVVYVRVDLNDFVKLPVDQPHNLGDKPLPAALGAPPFSWPASIPPIAKSSPPPSPTPGAKSHCPPQHRRLRLPLVS